MPLHQADQYLRSCTLQVSAKSSAVTLNVIDLSALRIKFSVKQLSAMTPNVGEIRVYNVEEATAVHIRDNFINGGLQLQAGYADNFGTIFQGNIMQVILGRESATDTFIDITAGDGVDAFNNAIIIQTLGVGATQENQVAAAVTEMSKKGVTAGHLGEFPQSKLPRGKVMYGPAKDYMRTVAQTTNKSWSIQSGRLTFVSNNSFLPGEKVVLTSKTGMIGTPQQTNEGVNVKCLLNPLLQVNRLIQIDNKSVERIKLDFSNAKTPPTLPADLSADGYYYILCISHQGDTRGVEWYTSLICLLNYPTANPANSVQPGYGQNGKQS